MFSGDYRDVKQAGPTRRGGLKNLALTGMASSFDLFGPSKKMGFGKEGEMTPEEMRENAMQLFKKPKQFH
jgi:hypothetical protein